MRAVHAGCHVSMTGNHTVTHVHGVMQNRTRETILKGFRATLLSLPSKAHSLLPFKERISNNSSNLKVNVVRSLRPLLLDHPKFEHQGLMLEAIINSPCSPSALDASVDVAVSALAKPISLKHGHYRGKYNDTRVSLCPLASPLPENVA